MTKDKRAKNFQLFERMRIKEFRSKLGMFLIYLRDEYNPQFLELEPKFFNQKKKREIVATLGSNLTLMNRILDIQADLAFEVLTLATKAIPNLQPTFEPAIQAMCKREKRPLKALNPTWLPLLQQFRTVDWKGIKQELEYSGIMELVRVR